MDLRGSDLPQLQEGRGELVADEAAGIWVALLLATCWNTVQNNTSKNGKVVCVCVCAVRQHNQSFNNLIYDVSVV